MENSLRKAMPLRRIVVIGLLVALGTVAAPFSIPVGVAKVYPVQHAINVLAGALLGPGPAVIAAVLTSTLRNLLGTGTPLAFPGSIFGALLAGMAFRLLKRDYSAALGELVGTGLIGGFAAFLLAKWVLGFTGLAYAIIIPFLLSSLAGSFIGLVILRFAKKNNVSYL